MTGKEEVIQEYPDARESFDFGCEIITGKGFDVKVIGRGSPNYGPTPFSGYDHQNAWDNALKRLRRRKLRTSVVEKIAPAPAENAAVYDLGCAELEVVGPHETQEEWSAKLEAKLKAENVPVCEHGVLRARKCSECSYEAECMTDFDLEEENAPSESVGKQEWPKYWLGEWQRVMGLAVMRQRTATENSQLIASIAMPKDEAEALGNKLLSVLRPQQSESPAATAILDGKFPVNIMPSLPKDAIHMGTEAAAYLILKYQPKLQHSESSAVEELPLLEPYFASHILTCSPEGGNTDCYLRKDVDAYVESARATIAALIKERTQANSMILSLIAQKNELRQRLEDAEGLGAKLRAEKKEIYEKCIGLLKSISDLAGNPAELEAQIAELEK
jgi:hypothetical protein